MLSIRKLKNKTINVLLVTTSLLTISIILELGYRIYDGEYHWENFLGKERNLFASSYPSQYDAMLGWIPKEGVSDKLNIWNTQVTINKYGIRSNDNKEKIFPCNKTILAVGNSFTFGDQVSNSETWPAILETLLKKKVINGGVFGYGIDQIYLRAKQLLKIFKAEILIFSFCPDDIKRCELSMRSSVNKPYFLATDNQLVLKNVPVPKPSSKHIIGMTRHLLGYSYFIHETMMNTYPEYWLQGRRWEREKRIHNEGEKVARLLLTKLQKLIIAYNINIYVLVQYDQNLDDAKLVNNVIAGINEHPSIEIIDLKYALSGLKQRDKEKYERLFQGHMTYEGNYWLALKLKNLLTNKFTR